MMVVIDAEWRKRTFHICPVLYCHGQYASDVIPQFYSETHALQCGWRFTRNSKYCDPAQPDYVWVCPHCIARNHNGEDDESN